MPVSLSQSPADMNRFDIAFSNVTTTSEPEGYVMATLNEDGETFSYLPFALNDAPLALAPFTNPVDAAKLCIADYVVREVACTDQLIAVLEATARDPLARPLTVKSVPRRIASAQDYRAKLLAGDA